MFNKGDKVFINKIIAKELFASANLPLALKNMLTKLKKFNDNPAEVVDVVSNSSGYTLRLKVAECYSSSSVPAVMSEGYTSGQGDAFTFENVSQASAILVKDLKQQRTISLINLSSEKIQAAQHVRLVYNNKNLFCMPIGRLETIKDHRGLIGKAISGAEPYQPCNIRLEEVCQLMSNDMHLKLNMRGRSNI